jgi:hypothetical protein
MGKGNAVFQSNYHISYSEMLEKDTSSEDQEFSSSGRSLKKNPFEYAVQTNPERVESY